MPDPNGLIVPSARIGLLCVAKCGSSAIRDAVGRALGVRVTQWSGGSYFWADAECASRLEGFTLFGFVRNPWDRFASFWRNRVRGHMSRCPPGFNEKMTLAEASLCAEKTPDSVAEHHFRSAWAQLSAAGRLVTNNICRVESLEDDWQRVREASAIPLPELRVVNSSGNPVCYDSVASDAVGRRYEMDVSTFGYQGQCR